MLAGILLPVYSIRKELWSHDDTRVELCSLSSLHSNFLLYLDLFFSIVVRLVLFAVAVLLSSRGEQREFCRGSGSLSSSRGRRGGEHGGRMHSVLHVRHNTATTQRRLSSPCSGPLFAGGRARKRVQEAHGLLFCCLSVSLWRVCLSSYGACLYLGGPLAMGIAGVCNRGNLRLKHNITTGDCADQLSDCCISAWCPCCALSQEWREVRHKAEMRRLQLRSRSTIASRVEEQVDFSLFAVQCVHRFDVCLSLFFSPA